MRPVIVKVLNEYFRTSIFSWIVPDLPVIYAGALFVCTVVFVKRARAEGLPAYHAWGAALWGTAAGIIGVRLWYLLANLGTVIQRPDMLWELNGSTVSFGGYFFGAGAFMAYLMHTRQEVPKYLDAASSCLGLGPMVARWACFLNGDDFGTVTSVPWAVRYPPGSYPFADHVNRGYVSIMADNSLPVHPVQIYLSMEGLVLLLVCTWLWKRRRLRPGMLFGIYWLLYSILRFVLEFFRGDYDVRYVNFFTPGQLVCVIIFATAIFFVAQLNDRGRRTRSAGGFVLPTRE